VPSFPFFFFPSSPSLRRRNIKINPCCAQGVDRARRFFSPPLDQIQNSSMIDEMAPFASSSEFGRGPPSPALFFSFITCTSTGYGNEEKMAPSAHFCQDEKPISILVIFLLFFFSPFPFSTGKIYSDDRSSPRPFFFFSSLPREKREGSFFFFHGSSFPSSLPLAIDIPPREKPHLVLVMGRAIRALPPSRAGLSSLFFSYESTREADEPELFCPR